ncbi:hypothetical protein ACF0H5_013326 [Mactra antiquata]
MGKSITATNMRHYMATTYVGLEILDAERETFYSDMGHNASINKHVYQSPLARQEITYLENFLKKLVKGNLLNDCWSFAQMGKSITATNMRHYMATTYVGLEILDAERETFYSDMGHNASINKHVYQSPLARQEITYLENFLKKLVKGNLLNDCWSFAQMGKSITATNMRHYMATTYVGLEILDAERETFYSDMGHNASINKHVYQSPLARQEITYLENFLKKLVKGNLLNDCWSFAQMGKSITATNMRHYMATTYVGLEILDAERETFYSDMGHNASVNKHVYQSPLARQEITYLENFLKKLVKDYDKLAAAIVRQQEHTACTMNAVSEAEINEQTPTNNIAETASTIDILDGIEEVDAFEKENKKGHIGPTSHVSVLCRHAQKYVLLSPLLKDIGN